MFETFEHLFKSIHRWGFPDVTSGDKNPPANSGIIRDTGLISGSEKSSGGEHGNPHQCSYLENPMGRGAWWAIVHRVT